MTRFVRSALGAAICVLTIGAASPLMATSKTFTAAAPDLVPIPSRILNGTVSVRNVGAANAGAFVVTVQCQKQGGGGCAEHRGLAAYADPKYPNRIVVVVPGLQKGKVFNLALPFWNQLNWAPGNYNFLLEVDPGKAVAETNEGNNFGGAVLSK